MLVKGAASEKYSIKRLGLGIGTYERKSILGGSAKWKQNSKTERRIESVKESNSKFAIRIQKHQWLVWSTTKAPLRADLKT